MNEFDLFWSILFCLELIYSSYAYEKSFFCFNWSTFFPIRSNWFANLWLSVISEVFYSMILPYLWFWAIIWSFKSLIWLFSMAIFSSNSRFWSFINSTSAFRFYFSSWNWVFIWELSWQMLFIPLSASTWNLAIESILGIKYSSTSSESFNYLRNVSGFSGSLNSVWF